MHEIPHGSAQSCHGHDRETAGAKAYKESRNNTIIANKMTLFHYTSVGRNFVLFYVGSKC
jgi:hypothetical protein